MKKLALVTIISSSFGPVAANPNHPTEATEEVRFAIKDRSFLKHIESADYALSPTEMIDFSASVQQDSVLLQWSVFWETGNGYFEVQRSTNARTWEVISVVEGAGANGTENNYIQSDPDPVRGQSFYRLKQIETDGRSKYSRTITIYYTSVPRARSILPNDSGGMFLIKNRSLSSRQMDLYNASGERIIFYSRATASGTQINLRRMPPGVYTLRIERGAILHSFVKLVKQ